MLFMQGLTSLEAIAIWAVFGIAIVGLLYALFLRSQILREDKGTEKMQEVWGAIKDGADAYLRRQLGSILPLIAILTVALFLSVYIVPPSAEALQRFAGSSEATVRLIIGIARAIAFIMGASFSLLVGQLGMRMAVQGNVRVASASRRSFGDALRIAYRAGTITGMLTDGLGLFGGTIIFIFMGKAAPDALLGFGFGGTLLALFMRVGGGIFTKAADVGADLVGKVEAGIPEDDPRNAAVIADLVGDNVGDCAGMAADIFESYEVTIVSAMVLGISVAMSHSPFEFKWILFPLLVRAIGVISSIISTYSVRSAHEGENAFAPIKRGFNIAAVISVVGFWIIALVYMNDWRVAGATMAGIVLALLTNYITEYFTGTDKSPVKEIARSTSGGPATTILAGLYVGMESSVWAAFAIAGSILASVLIFQGESFIMILYGVALCGIGQLTLTGNNISMDAFGPIADNANGIGEMTGMDKKSRQIMADLDAVGNTTKAITKGVAIGSAVIAAVSLFGSYITDVAKIDPTALVNGIRINLPIVFIGFLIGGALPWLFSSLAISAVSRAAGLIVEEVRRQFRIPGLMEDKVPPDYRQ